MFTVAPGFAATLKVIASPIARVVAATRGELVGIGGSDWPSVGRRTALLFELPESFAGNVAGGVGVTGTFVGGTVFGGTVVGGTVVVGADPPPPPPPPPPLDGGVITGEVVSGELMICAGGVELSSE